jgi:hypothetical protein
MYFGKINIRGCNSYVLVSLIDKERHVLLDKVIQLPVGHLNEIFEEGKPIILDVSEVDPGNYLLRSEFHMICNRTSYIVLSPLLSVRVMPNAPK